MKQSQALDILKMGHNVFLTGAAGSGKTYVLNQYISYLKNKHVGVAVTASTGIAATHIGGVTIHSWSGTGIREKMSNGDITKLLKKSYLRKHFLHNDVLVIDEVSMLHARQLDLVNRLCQTFREDFRPFGGLQVVLCGDFFQLPPVAKNGEVSRMVMLSDIWREMNLKVCYLHEQYRQNDTHFFNILNEIRANNVSDASCQLLHSRVDADLSSRIAPTKIYAHNVDVDAINRCELEKIDETAFCYSMKERGNPNLAEALKKGCLSPETLLLKVGAKVMFVKNNFEKGVVNGTIGEVIGWDDDRFPIVKIFSGEKVVVLPETWVIEEDGEVKADIRQIPLRLAWAITVHKSQGLSLDVAEVDLSRAFTPGMGYVALSRVRSLQGLSLKGFNEMSLVVDEEVLNFDCHLREMSEKTVEELKSLSTDDKFKKQQEFIGAYLYSAEKKSKKKRVSNKTKTKEMILQKMSLAEIAKAQNFCEGTIIGHIESLLKQGEKIDIAYLLPAEIDYNKIQAGFIHCGYEKLKPVFEHLQGEYQYDSLKLARAWFLCENS